MFKILVRNKDSEIRIVGWTEDDDSFAINIAGIDVNSTGLLNKTFIPKGTPVDDFLLLENLESLITTEVGAFETLPLDNCHSFADIKEEVMKHPSGLYLVLLEN